MTDKQIEELIRGMPFYIEQEHEYRCHCGSVHNRKYRYELKIKIIPHYTAIGPAHRFLAFYECEQYIADSSKKYIGFACGFGKATIKEALEELKGYLNNDR